MQTSDYRVAMMRSLISVILAMFSLATWAQNVDSAKETPRSAIAASLNFEGQQPSDVAPKSSKNSQLWVVTHSLKLAELVERYSGEAPIRLEVAIGERSQA